MQKIITYLKEVIQELKKVSWPNKEQTINKTVLVIVVSVFMTLYIGGLDFLFQQLMNLLIH